MKQCPTCNHLYDDDSLDYCLDDGATLILQDHSDDATPVMPAGVVHGEPEADPEPKPVVAKTKRPVRKPASAPPQRPALTSTNKAMIAAGVAVVLGVLLIVWMYKFPRSQTVSLSAEDMTLIAEDQSPQIRTRLATDEAFRKDFANNLRQLLAVADAARTTAVEYKRKNSDGTTTTEKKPISERAEIKRQLDLMRAVVIAENYFKSQQANQSAPATPMCGRRESTNSSQPANQAKFDQLLPIKAENPQMAGGDIPPEQIKQVRQELGKVLVGEQKGVKAGLDQKRKVQLQI